MKVLVKFDNPEYVSMASQSKNDELTVEFLAAKNPILDDELGIPIVYKANEGDLSINDFSFQKQISIPT